MATMRKWLNKRKFDWENGLIIIQETEGDYPGWEKPINAYEVGKDDPILDKKFHDGFGGPECPRFIASDDKCIYFPEQYDGSTRLCWVLKDIKEYLNIRRRTPYPGE